MTSKQQTAQKEWNVKTENWEYITKKQKQNAWRLYWEKREGLESYMNAWKSSFQLGNVYVYEP